MPIMVNCTCGQVMSIEDEFAGKTVVCSQCQRVVAVPAVGPGRTEAPPGATPNPYNPTSAGYAEAVSAGYQQAPGAYHSAQSLGRDKPSRGFLITGGVLTIVMGAIYLIFFGLLAAAAGAATSRGGGGLSGALAQLGAILGALAFLGLVGILLGSFTCASKGWAAIAGGGLMGLFSLALIFLMAKAGGRGTGVFLGFLLPTAAAALFSFLGIKQAAAYKTWQGKG